MEFRKLLVTGWAAFLSSFLLFALDPAMGQGAVLGVTLSQFGGGTAVANNIPAFQAAMTFLASAGGGTLFIDPPGIYNWVNAAPAGPVVVVPANVNIVCSSPAVVFKVNSAFEMNEMFLVQDVSHVHIRNCGFYGNSIATAVGVGGPLQVLMTNVATGPMTDIEFSGNVMTNFKQSSWVSVLNEGGYPIYGMNYNGNQCISQTGNRFTPIGPTACFGLEGQINNAGGTICQYTIDGGYGEGTYITTYVQAFNTCSGQVNGNRLFNFGITNLDTTSAIHTILSYELITGFDGRPYGFEVSGNYIFNSQQNHIYCERTDGCFFSNNYLDTTPDIAGVVGEPPVGIRVADSSGSSQGNTIVNGGNPDYAIVQGDGRVWTVQNDVGTSAVASTHTNIAFQVSGYSATATGTSLLNVVNCRFSRTGGSNGEGLNIITTSGSSGGIGTLNISGGAFTASGWGLFGSDVSGVGSALANAINVSGNAFFQGAQAGFQLVAYNRPLTIAGATIDGSIALTGGYPLKLSGATNLFISGLLIQNVGSGVGSATDTANSCGSVSGVQFHDATPGQYGLSSAPGIVAPTCTGQPGWFYQNFDPSGVGSLHGWTWAAGTWVAD